MLKIKQFINKQIKDILNKGFKILFLKFYLLLKLTIKLFLLFAFGIFVPFIFILKKKINFHFFELPTDRIGCFCAWEPFILITHFNRKLKKKDKKIFFIYHSKIISNNFLLDLYKKKMKSLNSYYFLHGYSFWELLTSSYQFWTGQKIKTYFKARIIYYPIFVKTDRMVFLSNEDIEKGETILEKFNIPKNSKWICVHNRDSEYLNSQKKKGYMPHQDFSYHNIRDFSADDLIPAAEYFTQKGYYVIRIGSKSNQKFNTKNSMIIDFVNSKYRTDFAEIYFLDKCEFYFGSSAGCWKVAKIFRKPAYLVNHFPFGDLFVYPWKHPGIFKKIRLINENRIISIKEMIKYNLNQINDENLLKKMGFEVLNNTPEEILSLAIESEELHKLKDTNVQFSIKQAQVFQEMEKSESKNFKYYKNPIGKEFLSKINL